MIDDRTHKKILSALRKISFYHPQNRIAMKRSMNSVGDITCEKCGIVVTSSKEVNRDHIVPVIPLTGFDSWDGVIERMFCGPKGIQILCKSNCHAKKTRSENSRRVRKKKV